MSETLRKPDWQKGDVRLWCGDCVPLLAEMPDASVDLIWTDPPFGHNNNNGDLIHRREAALGRGEAGEAREIANDGAEANDLYHDLLPEFRRLLSPGCCCCCCGGGGGPDPQFARWSLWMDEVFAFKQMVVWDKGPMGMGWHYRRSYETVLVGQKPGAACRWFDESNRVENIIRDVPKIIPRKTQHPCIKPVELPRRFIQWHTEPGQVVCDPFMGEGPCGVAAVKMGRAYVGIELDSHWFDIAVRRIEEEMNTLF